MVLSKNARDFRNRDDRSEAQKHQEREECCAGEDVGDGNAGIVERRLDRIDRYAERRGLCSRIQDFLGGLFQMRLYPPTSL